MSRRSMVIVGGGLAGAAAAAPLRKDGFDGSLVLVGDEAERPYERPPLSKDYLRDDTDATRSYVHGASFYADQRIELRTGHGRRAIDTAARTSSTTARAAPFDRLLLATGRRPRSLAVPGADLDGVRYLRDLADADALRAAASTGRAHRRRRRGLDRHRGGRIAPPARSQRDARRPGGGAAGAGPRPGGGGVYRALHASTVSHLADQRVTAVTGLGPRAWRPTAGSASTPTWSWWASAPNLGRASPGPPASRSPTASSSMRGSRRALTGVFAAGDVAGVASVPCRRLRVEHWDNARHQGRRRRTMLGTDEPYNRLPYFYSDQYDLGMEYIGRADLGPGRRAGRPGKPRVRRVLDAGRAGRRRHERECAQGQRADPGAHRRPDAHRSRAAGRCRRPARGARAGHGGSAGGLRPHRTPFVAAATTSHCPPARCRSRARRLSPRPAAPWTLGGPEAAGTRRRRTPERHFDGWMRPVVRDVVGGPTHVFPDRNRMTSVKPQEPPATRCRTSSALPRPTPASAHPRVRPRACPLRSGRRTLFRLARWAMGSAAGPRRAAPPWRAR